MARNRRDASSRGRSGAPEPVGADASPVDDEVESDEVESKVDDSAGADVDDFDDVSDEDVDEDEDAAEESDDGLAEDDLAEDDDDRAVVTSAKSVKTKSDAKAAKKRPAKADAKDKRSTRRDKQRRAGDEVGPRGPLAWLQSAVRFLREIYSEMRKVIWPSRQELITYTVVVVIFVTILVAIVAGLDIGFAKLVLWVFG